MNLNKIWMLLRRSLLLYYRNNKRKKFGLNKETVSGLITLNKHHLKYDNNLAYKDFKIPRGIWQILSSEG